jgi:UDP-N-acetylglucosamine diphosphorylase/glucosamine-1-phosphate N-acetyltransferase
MAVNIVLFDPPTEREQLLPFTFTRPVAEIRCGILTITEKWQHRLGGAASHLTVGYLAKKYSANLAEDNLIVDGSLLPDDALVAAIQNLQVGNALVANDKLLAARCDANTAKNIDALLDLNSTEYTNNVNRIANPWDIFKLNGEQITLDYQLIANGKKSQAIPKDFYTVNPENIFIEEGAQLSYGSLNASAGPIYIGKKVQVMEGAMIRGPFAALEGCEIKMAAKIYAGTTLGPYCKAGGEISNSVMFGYSNKGHDGFLGNSVLGEWCNLGADTNNSNLKNDYSDVKLWSYVKKSFVSTGLQFCGLMMGDHSKAGINSMFNTGTVVGVFCNIFGDGFPRNFIPSYSWGGANGFTDYKIDKALKVAQLVMERRNIPLTVAEKEILTHIYNDANR